mgnify:CR=1 FL=1
MIRNEAEYQEALARLSQEQDRLAKQRDALVRLELSDEEVERGMEPLRSFHLQLVEEIESYERLERGDLGEAINLLGLGRMLVAARIAKDMTQRELAERMGVHESQVSRDERNEYHGITLERASRVLDALGVTLVSEFSAPVTP